jgi:hypothetical protein
MLNEEQKRHLRTRADLDRIEAESELQAAESPGSFKLEFSEGARQDLVRLTDYLAKPPSALLADADRREAQRFASLIQTLEKIASTAPSQLACASCFTREAGRECA